jgi:hypothetical protein
LPESRFLPSDFLPREIYERISGIRVEQPNLAARTAGRRVRRRVLTRDGKLVLLAADHPARMTIAIRGDPTGMGKRHELLSRILRVMVCSRVDGLLGTADVIDELLILENLLGRTEARAFLDDRVLLGSMNRGGLSGSVFELDDGPTGYDAEGIAEMNLDGGKFLLRIDPARADSAKALAYCVEAVKACGARKLPIFVEPLPVITKDGKVTVLRKAEDLIRIVGVASALGSSSAQVWLKLPYCEEFSSVVEATTLPILLLGGDAMDDVGGLLGQVELAMKAGSNVRGVLMGRNLLYPAEGDPLPVAEAVTSMVHEGIPASVALGRMEKSKDTKLDILTSNP